MYFVITWSSLFNMNSSNRNGVFKMLCLLCNYMRYMAVWQLYYTEMSSIQTVNTTHKRHLFLRSQLSNHPLIALPSNPSGKHSEKHSENESARRWSRCFSFYQQKANLNLEVTLTSENAVLPLLAFVNLLNPYLEQIKQSYLLDSL